MPPTMRSTGEWLRPLAWCKPSETHLEGPYAYYILSSPYRHRHGGARVFFSWNGGSHYLCGTRRERHHSGSARSIRNERSAVPAEDGLKLNTAAGDSVDIANNVATWRDQAGNIIASIDLDNEGNENVAFRYDEATRMFVAETAHHGGVMAAT
ncbi:hypothetical protein CIP107561_01222 [Corynebacterium diphtheriae]|nr:hypothetical protein CIP107561_01222 [Corynebacterium diphtheriae]